jgi:hypothetical protein
VINIDRNPAYPAIMAALWPKVWLSVKALFIAELSWYRP